jgi:hypothetical protein
MLLIHFFSTLGKSTGNGALALLFVFFLYPSLVIGVFAIYYWRDNNWELSAFVTSSLIAMGSLVVWSFGVCFRDHFDYISISF